MTVSANVAARRYRRGIRGIGGASTYKKCGRRKGQGFLAVASCLESAKREKLTTDMMVRHYRQAATGGGGAGAAPGGAPPGGGT